MMRRLEHAFRDVPKLAPEYDFFAVHAGDSKPIGRGTGAERGASTGAENISGAPEGAALPEPGEEQEAPQPSLLPAGALESLQIIPALTRVERLGRRVLRAHPRDAEGRKIRRPITIRWHAAEPLGMLETTEGAMTAFVAGSELGRATVLATAREGERQVESSAVVHVVDAQPASDLPRTGIPEPLFVHEAGQSWRSRLRGGQWEINSGHADFQAASETPRRKLRYLAALLAKEVVLHSFPQPQLGSALERLVEVLTITERRLEKS
ncbi:MAG: hypothetical protein ACE5I7_05890 [Candidatus Binatia bacterium]